MKILHITNTDAKGGAAIATIRLHNAMLNNGFESHVLVANKSRLLDDSISVCYSNKLEFFLDKYIKPYLNARLYWDKSALGDYSHFEYGVDLSKNENVLNADVIYLHWINRGFVSAKGLEKILKLGKPVIWFMHDMFPITGGCHHSFDCINFTKCCENCRFFSEKKTMTAKKQMDLKIKLKSYSNLHWVAPSQWLYDLSKQSSAIESKRLYHIPNIKSEAFAKQSKEACRSLLNLDSQKKYILFGADNVLKSPYKGFNFFTKMLNDLYGRISDVDEIEVLLFGSYYSKIIEDKIPFRVHFLGCLSDELSMSVVYNTADVFVSTSIAESFSLTTMESISCGVPVAAFNVGGIPDMVGLHDNGLLASKGNTKELADNVYSLLFSDNINKKITIDDFCGVQRVLSHHSQLINTIRI